MKTKLLTFPTVLRRSQGNTHITIHKHFNQIQIFAKNRHFKALFCKFNEHRRTILFFYKYCSLADKKGWNWPRHGNATWVWWSEGKNRKYTYILLYNCGTYLMALYRKWIFLGNCFKHCRNFEDQGMIYIVYVRWKVSEFKLF